MSDADKPADRPDSESDRDPAERSDEQLWKELETEETGKKPPADEDGEDGDLPGDPDPDPDPKPSDDARDGDVDTGNTDGKDPEALQAQIDRLQRSLDSYKGRASQNQREVNRLKAELAAAADEQAQRNKNDDELLKEERKKVKASREEYPEVVGALVDTVERLEGRLDDLSAREKRQLEQAQARLTERLDEQWGVFTDEHPDGLDVISKNRETFDRWLQDQPKLLRDIYAANEQDVVDGTQAAFLVSQFKAVLLDADSPGSAPDTDRLQTRRQRQLAGARSTRTPGRQQASSAPPEDAADASAHWDYWDRKDRQRAR